MKNIFTELIIPCHYFNNSINLEDIKTDLWYYLNDNLEIENYNILSSNLQLALKNNLNE